jgi:multidrug efflux pump subunit AcrA (membrane-fusion protein)
MKRITSFIIPVLIVLAGVCALVFFSSFKEDPPKKPHEVKIKIAAAEKVKLKDIKSRVVAYGRLKSSQPVVMTSEVNGILEQGSLDFRPGQTFKKGDLLIKVDDRQMRFDIKSRKSDLLNALASVLPEIRVDFPEHYKKWEDYFNKVSFDKNIPDLPEASNQKIKLYLSRFNVYKIYFNIKSLEIKLGKHSFYASFDGAVISTDLRIGSSVRPGTRLGRIINLESLEMEVPVPAEDISWIDRNEPVVLTSSEIAGQWTGRIKRIGKTIDTKTQTVYVYIGVQERDEKLINGVFMKAEMSGRIIKNAFAVPRKAIYEDSFVYVIADGVFDYRRVDVARRELDYVIVKDGLKEGEMMVTEMLQGVASGMAAQVKLSSNGKAL